MIDGKIFESEVERDSYQYFKTDPFILDDVIGSTVFPKNTSEGDKIKFKLCCKILEYKLFNNLSQKELAEKLSVDEPEMSRVLEICFDSLSEVNSRSISCIISILHEAIHFISTPFRSNEYVEVRLPTDCRRNFSFT